MHSQLIPNVQLQLKQEIFIVSISIQNLFELKLLTYVIQVGVYDQI